MSKQGVYRNSGTWLMAPALAFWALLLVVPTALIISMSLHAGDRWSFANYARAFDPLYGRILMRSVWLALATTLVSLVIAYPVGWAIRNARRDRQLLLLALIAVPSWLNLLVKNYAWIVLLRREGIINSLLGYAGVIHSPLPLLFNEWAVLAGLLHTNLPFMILPIYAGLERIDQRLIEAAQDLGASRMQIFRRVVIPQSTRAAMVGCVLVFTATLGAFVTPDLLGGPKSLMVASVIESQVLQVRDWNFAAALSVLLLSFAAVTGAAYAITNKRRAAV